MLIGCLAPPSPSQPFRQQMSCCTAVRFVNQTLEVVGYDDLVCGRQPKFEDDIPISAKAMNLDNSRFHRNRCSDRSPN